MASAWRRSRRWPEEILGGYSRATSRGSERTRRRSVAARERHASEKQKRTLQRWFTGTDVITAEAREAKSSATTCLRIRWRSEAARAAANRRASTLRRAFNFIRGVPLQRFYPQCESCSALRASPCARAPSTRDPLRRRAIRRHRRRRRRRRRLHYDDVKARVDDVVDRARRVLRD